LIQIQKQGDALVFWVRVQPRARQDAIEGEWHDSSRGGGSSVKGPPDSRALKVRLKAPPVDDRANEACRRLLAVHLNIPLAAVRILGGKRSRIKRVEVRGASAEQIQGLTGSSGGFGDQA
jgi:uncharacterized protein YggU (UPF0235/DUF167 family)